MAQRVLSLGDWLRGCLPAICEGVGFEDFSAFLDDVEAIHFEVIQGVDSAGGPANFDQVNLLCGSEAEVDAEVIGGVVAVAGADFFDLRQRRAGFGVE